MICKTCNKEKPESAFSQKKECASGYDTSRCKDCKKASWDWQRVTYEKRMLNRTVARAKRRGIECTIVLEDIVLPKFCPVFVMPFIYGDPDWTYSIDRLDNTKGYTKENIVIISNKANRIKNNATADELQMVVNYMRACEVDFDQLGKE